MECRTSDKEDAKQRKKLRDAQVVLLNLIACMHGNENSLYQR